MDVHVVHQENGRMTYLSATVPPPRHQPRLPDPAVTQLESRSTKNESDRLDEREGGDSRGYASL